MTEAKHTPGPWTYQEYGLIRGAGNHRVADPIVVNNDTEQAHANARLIAAAPDMLNALTRLADVADAMGDEANSGLADEAIASARNIIAKATGAA